MTDMISNSNPQLSSVADNIETFSTQAIDLLLLGTKNHKDCSKTIHFWQPFLKALLDLIRKCTSTPFKVANRSYQVTVESAFLKAVVHKARTLAEDARLQLFEAFVAFWKDVDSLEMTLSEISLLILQDISAMTPNMQIVRLVQELMGFIQSTHAIAAAVRCSDILLASKIDVSSAVLKDALASALDMVSNYCKGKFNSEMLEQLKSIFLV